MPDGALPYKDASYSYVSKHFNTNTSSTGNLYLPIVSGGGGGGNNTGCEFGFFNNVYTTNWYGSQVNLGTVTPNTVFAFTYQTGAANNSAAIYVNYGSGDISSGWTPGNPANTIRNQPITPNYIGQGAWHTVDKINSQIYYLYMFNTALTQGTDRLAIEATATPLPPMITPINNIITNSTGNGFTVTWSGGTGMSVTTTYTINGSAATPSSLSTGM